MKKQEKIVYQTISDEEPFCQICGQAYNLHRHHIRYGACGRKTYFGNIIVLCEKCHKMVHANKKRWQSILIEMADEHERNMGRE